MKKAKNERCPLSAECEKRCSFTGRELDCDYYRNNARPGYELYDQEERRRGEWRQAEDALLDTVEDETLPERTIEVITEDILDAQRRGGEAILTIGRCLIEAKEMLPHGEWLPIRNGPPDGSCRCTGNFQIGQRWPIWEPLRPWRS